MRPITTQACGVLLTVLCVGCTHHPAPQFGPASGLAPRNVEVSRRTTTRVNELALDMTSGGHITVYRVMPNESITLFGLRSDAKAPAQVEMPVASGHRVVVLGAPVMRLVEHDRSGHMYPEFNRAAEGFGYLPQVRCPTSTQPYRYCDVPEQVPLSEAPALKAHLVVVATRDPVDSTRLSEALRALDGSGEIDDLIERLGRATASATTRPGQPSSQWAAGLGVTW